MGRYRLEARADPAGGWRLSGKLEPGALARLAGFDLRLASETAPDLTTLRFEKRVRSPLHGEYRLVVVAGDRVYARRFRNGVLEGRYTARRRVWDDLSLVYHIRVQPRAGELAFLGLYGVVRGRLSDLGTRTTRVPAGAFATRVFRFDEPAAFFEIEIGEPWRLPVRIVFGYGEERVTARLLGRR